jgi:hypothetical protein
VPSNGWIAELKVHAALHNQAGLYNATSLHKIDRTVRL